MEKVEIEIPVTPIISGTLFKIQLNSERLFHYPWFSERLQTR